MNANKFVANVSRYSMYYTKDWYIEDEDTRVASVFDKIFELAARKCDSYASDAFYLMQKFYEAVDKSEECNFLIFFEPHSVDFISFDDIDFWKGKNFIACRQCAWLLGRKKCGERFDWKNYLIRVNVFQHLEDEVGQAIINIDVEIQNGTHIKKEVM